jgi:hypothetical protein
MSTESRHNLIPPSEEFPYAAFDLGDMGGVVKCWLEGN